MPATAAIHLVAVVPVIVRVEGSHVLCNAPGCVVVAVGPDGERVLHVGPVSADFDVKAGEHLEVRA